MKSGKCESCRWWKVPDDAHGSYLFEAPIDPDTMEPMQGMVIVRRCTSPNLLFHERPVDYNQAAVFDGSEYFGMLITASKFSCANWEAE